MNEHINESIIKNAETALSVSNRDGSVTAHSLRDQIAAAQYIAGVMAQQKGLSGLRIINRIGNPSGDYGQGNLRWDG